MLLVALLENGLLKRKRGDVIFMSTARSTEAAAKLFPDAAGPMHLVFDRYSVYKKLACLPPAVVVLCFCRVHARRDFLKCAAERAAAGGMEG